MDVKGVAPKDVIPEALILETSTKAGHVDGDAPAVRVPFVSLDGAAAFIPEGDGIPETDPDDTEVVIHTGKIASLIAVSREQHGQEDAAALLSDAMREDLVRKANKAFLAQAAPDPAVTPPAGLINQGVHDGGILSDEDGHGLDDLIDAVAHIEAAGGKPTHVLAHPTSWAWLAKLKKEAGGNESLLGAGTSAEKRMLLSLPVLVDRDVPASSLIVLDKKAVLSVHGDIQLTTSQDYYFNRDTIAIRATWRFGIKVSDTNRVVLLGIGGSEAGS